MSSASRDVISRETDRLVRAIIDLGEDRASARRAADPADDGLRLMEQRFRAAVVGMFDAFALCSAVRDESGRVVDFVLNHVHAGGEPSELPSPEHTGDRLLHALPIHLGAEVFEELADVVETGRPFRTETVHWAAGSRPAVATDVRAVRFGDGVIVGWTDVTPAYAARPL